MSLNKWLPFLETQIAALTVDDVEVFLQERQHLTLQSKDGELDAMTEAREQGLAIRVLKQGHIGFSCTTDLSESALAAALQEASDSADTIEVKETQRFADFKKARKFPVLAQFDESLATRPLSEKIKQVQAFEQDALNYHPDIQQVRMCTYQELIETVSLWRLTHEVQSYQKSRCEAHLMALSRKGQEQESYWNLDFAPCYDQLQLKPTAEAAAAEAVARLSGQSLATGSYPAILDHSVAAAFLGILAPAFLAESVQRQKSPLGGRLGQLIYSPAVTVMDDGQMDAGHGSAPFDGEGVPSQETCVVAEGRLQSYLYDTLSAARDGVASTGNSVRSQFKDAPRAGIRNLYIKAGNQERSTLLQEMGEGLLIGDVIGMHTANPITGDFSVGASGYWIRNGKRAEPVRGFAISGNLHHILKSVSHVASDLKFYGPIGAPSLRIAELSVGGTS